MATSRLIWSDQWGQNLLTFPRSKIETWVILAGRRFYTSIHATAMHFLRPRFRQPRASLAGLDAQHRQIRADQHAGSGRSDHHRPGPRADDHHSLPPLQHRLDVPNREQGQHPAEADASQSAHRDRPRRDEVADSVGRSQGDGLRVDQAEERQRTILHA